VLNAIRRNVLNVNQGCLLRMMGSVRWIVVKGCMEIRLIQHVNRAQLGVQTVNRKKDATAVSLATN
jgi:hypothetical protein